MANRNSSAAFQSEIVKDQNQPIHLLEVYFDAPTGTQYMTDAYIPITYDSNTYLAGGYFLSFTDIEETNQLQVSSITIGLSGVDKTYINYVLDEDFVDRKVIIRKGFLSSTDDSLIADPIVIFQGNMDTPIITEAEDEGKCTVSVTVANLFADFEKTPGRFTNSQSQNVFYPNDRGFEYASQIIKDVVWGAEYDPGTRVSGAGSLASEVGSVIVERDLGYPEVSTQQVTGNGVTVNTDGTAVINDQDGTVSVGTEVVLTNYEGHYGEIEGTTLEVTSVSGKTYTVTLSTPAPASQVLNDGGNEIVVQKDGDDGHILKPGVTTESGTNKVKIEQTKSEDNYTVGDLVQLVGVTEEVGGITANNLNGEFHTVQEVSEKYYILGIEEDKTYTAPPLQTTSGSSVVTVNEENHDKSTGDTVVITGAVATGGIAAGELNASHSIGYIEDANKYQITVSSSASSSVNHGGGSALKIDSNSPQPTPISTTSGSATVTVYQSNHGLSASDKVTISGALSVGGIDSMYLNRQHTVVAVPDTDSFTITLAVDATSTAEGGGTLIIVRVPIKATSTTSGGGADITTNKKLIDTTSMPWGGNL